MSEVGSAQLALDGLNVAERGLVWAFARHGGGVELLGGLEGDPAAALEPVIGELSRHAPEVRRQIAAAWSFDEGRESSGIAWLVALRAQTDVEARAWFADFGLYAFTELLRRQDRRRLARALRAMPAAMAQTARRWLRDERPIEHEELQVIREAYVGIGRETAEVEGQMWQLGIYLVALAAGGRYADCLREACRHLGRAHRRQLAYYLELCARSTRRNRAPAIRACLEGFVRDAEGVKEGER